MDTIEHGFNGTPEVFKLMAARGVAYLPTLTAEEAYGGVLRALRARESPRRLPAWRQAKRAFAAAMKAGVTIGCGSDVGVFTHGTNYRELRVDGA